MTNIILSILYSNWTFLPILFVSYDDIDNGGDIEIDTCNINGSDPKNGLIWAQSLCIVHKFK